MLRRDGRELHIEQEALNVLSYLIERRGEVVQKVDLLNRVWAIGS